MAHQNGAPKPPENTTKSICFSVFRPFPCDHFGSQSGDPKMNKNGLWSKAARPDPEAHEVGSQRRSTSNNGKAPNAEKQSTRAPKSQDAISLIFALALRCRETKRENANKSTWQKKKAYFTRKNKNRIRRPSFLRHKNAYFPEKGQICRKTQRRKTGVFRRPRVPPFTPNENRIFGPQAPKCRKT